VKIWFQNRRSKCKKLAKQHGGERSVDQAAACLLSSTVNGGLVPEDVCAATPSPSSPSPSPSSPPESKSFHEDKQSTVAVPPEFGGSDISVSFDHLIGVHRAADMPSVVSAESTAPVGDWTWRTDVFEPFPYASWTANGLNAAATAGCGLNQPGGRVFPSRSAVEQWMPMSGFDRRYGGGLVGASQSWCTGYAVNTRHTSPV